MRSIRVQANGLRFSVLEEGDGEKLALCLHGFPELGYSWRHQLPLLARLGYRAWAPDLRGYGRTERPPRTRDYAIELLIDDACALIEAAGASRATVLAHDWGGVVAWYLAMRRPAMLERLIVCNMPHPAPLGREMRRLDQLRRLYYVGLFQLPRLPERLLARDGSRAIANAFLSIAYDPTCFSDEDLSVFRDAASEPGALHAMLAYYRAYVRGGGRRRQARIGYPIIRTPTLLVWGERDPVLTKASTIGTSEWVEDLTVRYLPEASHWVQQERPAQVNAILEAWLTGAPVPQAWEIEPSG